MPTGIAIPDARQALYAAADRVVERDGVSALTSRSITLESGVAKGVLHRHFADFETFLADYVGWHVEQLDVVAAELNVSAGTGTVVANLATALTRSLTPLGLSMITLVVSRPAVRARLRASTPYGIPILAQLTGAISAYLDQERGLHRVSSDADATTLALTLVGTAHLLFAGELGATPDEAAVREVVASILVGVETPQ